MWVNLFIFRNVDGQYPAHGLQVLFSVDAGDTYIGGFEDGAWFGQDGIVCKDADEIIFWTPLWSVNPEINYKILQSNSRKGK